jgi:predicted outer membrane repeat protein
MSCSAIAGSVTNSSDCDDAAVIYADNDGDTFGAGPMVACNGVASNSDCNDSSNAVFPGAAELCADLAVDNDCDGSTDEAEAADRLTFYADADNDGAGDPNVTQLACSAPAGYVGTAGDNCPADGAKTDPGACGCGVADTDTDADGTADCIDQCPTDPAKTEPGTCGCNVADTDGDGDGLADCVDNCPAIANADQADCNQNGTGDLCEIASGSASDCNTNGVPDSCDIAAGSSTDLDGSGSPDECEFVVGGTGFATIQLALDAAPNGAVIKVGPGSHAPFTAINRGLIVQSIAGDTQTFIDGGNSARAVEISGRVGTRLTLRGFTIRNGSAANGGGMLVTNADPVIENCTFSGNIASGSGGAIHAINSAADILLSSFLGNAAANGGAIALEGSSGIEGGMHISSSIFRDNDAAVDGGAIMSASDLFLLECTLELNAAGSLGGGVRQLDSGRLTVFTSRFCRNLPENISGAFSAVGDNVLSQDCNANGICDADEIAEGDVPDCNANGLPDACDIAGGAADCNENGIPDSCDLAAGTSNDVDANGIPDECKPDCNNNDIPDAFEIATGAVADCNGNAIPDSCDIAAGTAADCNANGAIDACELAEGLVRDCNLNGIPDSCDIAGGATDFDQDGRIDRCEMARGDLNLDGLVNAIDIAIILSYWGTGSAGDANGDGNIDAQDIATVLSNWNLPMP